VLSPPSSPGAEQRDTLEGELYFHDGDGTKARFRGKDVDALTGCVVVIQFVLLLQYPSIRDSDRSK